MEFPKQNKNPEKNRLPLFEQFITENCCPPNLIAPTEDTPKDLTNVEFGSADPDDEKAVSPVANKKKINVEGIEITFNTNINDLKGDIHYLKERMVKLEKMIEALIVFERYETPQLASKVKKVLSAINEQGLDYSYDVSISAYCEIKAYVNIKADGKIDDSIGGVITEVFTSKPALEYYEMPTDESISINLKY